MATGNEAGSYFTSTGIWFRQWYIASGWTEWHKISGFLHTNIGTTGKQLLTMESNKKSFLIEKSKIVITILISKIIGSSALKTECI